MKRTLLILLNIICVIVLILFYIVSEYLTQGDFSCGCSMGCANFCATGTSKAIGFTLIFASILLFSANLWKAFNLSRWWLIVSIVIIITA